MANIRLVKRRIKSAKNISQITRAMQMVAASKMRKAQERALAGKPYAEKIAEMVRELVPRTGVDQHPLLRHGNPQGKPLIILISTNKGLAGGLNTALFRLMTKWFTTEPSLDVITFGKKGQQYIVRTGKSLIADFSPMVPFTQHVASVAKLAVEGFIEGKYKKVYLVFNTFVSALKQQPTRRIILPMDADEGELQAETPTENDTREFLIEPSAREVLNALLPHYVENQIRSAMLEADASEHSARMMAMKNATDAASDLVDGLTLIYNKARQEKITNEIADIVTARLAVE